MSSDGGSGDDLSIRRSRLLEVVRGKAVQTFDEPKVLASGALSHVFIDVKAGLCRGSDLALACSVIADSVAEAGIGFDAVGGLTMGADQFAYGVAIHLGGAHEWFVVRKEPKGRGTDRLVEGARLDESTRVLLVDDAVTTGGSIQKAYRAVVDTGAEVVAAVTLADRGEVARRFFEAEAVPYLPVFTYVDLGIDPIDG